jgi:Holliday junction resolvase-like predicted endonuclease
LKLTRHGPFQRKLLEKDARASRQIVDKILGRLCESGFCRLKQDVIEANTTQRVKIAVQAIKLSADFERVCRFLHWREFETLASEAFRANNYNVIGNFRFKQKGKRWEIDLLAFKEPLVVCVDCKHWHHGWGRAAIIKAVEAQIERTEALAEAFPLVCEKMELEAWSQTLLIPAVLSLVQAPFKFHNKVPVVPILQLRNFLNELPAYARLLTHFSIKSKN